MREVQVGVRVGVDVERGAEVRDLVDVEDFVVDVVLEVVFGVVFEEVGADDVEVGRGVVVSLVSWIGRSSTGGGSDGAAATRNPRRTSKGTQSMTARSIPSRPMRRRGLGFMAVTLGRWDEPCVSVG